MALESEKEEDGKKTDNKQVSTSNNKQSQDTKHDTTLNKQFLRIDQMSKQSDKEGHFPRMYKLRDTKKGKRRHVSNERNQTNIYCKIVNKNSSKTLYNFDEDP